MQRTLLTESSTGHYGPQVSIIPKKAAGLLVTISRVAYGTQVTEQQASQVSFGYLHKEANFPGVKVGDELCTGVKEGFFNTTKYLMSTPIKKIELLMVSHGVEVWRVTTESGSVYDLHAIK